MPIIFIRVQSNRGMSLILHYAIKQIWGRRSFIVNNKLQKLKGRFNFFLSPRYGPLESQDAAAAQPWQKACFSPTCARLKKNILTN